MTDDDLSPEENRLIGNQIREELARRRLSRQHLADKAKGKMKGGRKRRRG